MGIVFFVLTVIVVPFLPAGGTVPRWAFLSLVCAGLLTRVRLTWGIYTAAGYLALMAWVAPVGFDAAYLYWHALLLIVIFGFARDYDRMDAMIVGAGLGLAVSSAFVIAQYFGYTGVPELQPFSGLFYNRNLASEAAAMVLVMAVYTRRWWLVPGLLPTLAVGSRSPLLAIAFVAAVGLYRAGWRWMLLLIPAVAVALMLAIGDFHHSSQLATLDERFGVWLDTLRGLTLFGHGLGSFMPEFPLLQTHKPTLEWRYENTHNDVLQVIYELGLPAAVVLAVAATRFARAFPSAAWYGLLVFVIEGLFAFPLYEPVTGAMAAVCAGSIFADGLGVWPVIAAGGRRIWARHADHAAAVFPGGGSHLSAQPDPALWRSILRHHPARPRHDWRRPTGAAA